MPPQSRIPPHSEEAEKALIGCVLMDAETVLQICLDRKLHVDCFYVPAHRTIITAMGTLWGQQQPVDISTVSDYLQQRGDLERLGGPLVLDRMVDAAVSITSAGYHADQILDAYRRRQYIDECRRGEAQAFDPDADFEGLLNQTQNAMFQIGEGTEAAMTREEALNEFLGTAEKAAEGDVDGLACFIPQVNWRLGNFRKGKPYIIGAPPGGGKSTFLENQFRYWAQECGVPCGVASIEMSADEFYGQMACERGDVSYFALMNNMRECKNDEPGTRLAKATEGAQKLRDIPLYVNDRIETFDQFEAWARVIVRKYGVEAIGIDYVQILEPGKRCKAKTERERLVWVTNQMRRLAKALNIVILILSQLSGDAADGKTRPTMGSLFGSRSLNQAVRGVIMLYELDGKWFVEIQKNNMGGVGAEEVNFEKARQRWTGPGFDSDGNKRSTGSAAEQDFGF